MQGRSILIIETDKNGNLKTDLKGNLTTAEVICAFELVKASLIRNSEKTGAIGFAPKRF
jgi:hypothetical protein